MVIVFTLILILKNPFVVKNLKKITYIADTDNDRDACNSVVGSDGKCSIIIFCGAVVRVELVVRVVGNMIRTKMKYSNLATGILYPRVHGKYSRRIPRSKLEFVKNSCIYLYLSYIATFRHFDWIL